MKASKLARMVAAAASGVQRAAISEASRSTPALCHPAAYQVAQTVSPWVQGTGQAFFHAKAAPFGRSAYDSPASTRVLSRALPSAYVATRTASSAGKLRYVMIKVLSTILGILSVTRHLEAKVGELRLQ